MGTAMAKSKKLKNEAELLKEAIRAGVEYAEGRGVVEFEANDSANEKIEYIGPDNSICGHNTIDAGGKYVLPGVLDPHTHPVYLDNLKGLSKTAAFGGVTTVVHYAYAKPGKSLTATLKDYINEGKRQFIMILE